MRGHVQVKVKHDLHLSGNAEDVEKCVTSYNHYIPNGVGYRYMCNVPVNGW